MINITKKFIEQIRKNPIDTLKTLSEDEIATVLQKANYSYYNTQIPLFSDNLFDMIREYLENINPLHPILTNIGSVSTEEKKEILPYFMGSLDKIKADPKAIEKFKKEYTNEYIVSDKLDGNSAMIQYINGEMKLYTRGDGTLGQNISHLIPFIKNIIPLNKNNNKNSEITLRGELIISREDFETVKDKGANARNMVAGLINAKVPDLQLIKLVQFVGYELIKPILEPGKQFKYISNIGYKSVFNTKVNQDKINIDELSKILIHRREISEFEIDGIVIFHNKLHKKEKENPKYAFAFKSILTMKQAEVIVTNVEWNMSKDGYLIPVVNFNPVSLAGVTIKRAHGFNGKFIKDNKIGPGSKIIILRSGDVIPYITEILSPSEIGQGQFPDIKYTWTKTGVDILLTIEDQKESEEFKFKNLVYFFDKIDVKGLSEGNIKKIYDSGKKTVKDIFNITVNDLLKVEGFKIKMAEKISIAIHERIKTLECTTIMNASNTLGRGMGLKKIELIVLNIPSILQKRYIPSMIELLSLKGIEKITASTFITNLPKYFEFIDNNEIKCILPINETNEEINNSQKIICPPGCKPILNLNTNTTNLHISTNSSQKIFKDMKFVFTGFRNDILEKYIKNNGGEVTTSISKKITAVICKDVTDDSTKIKKAESLKVPIINLIDFMQQYNIVL